MLRDRIGIYRIFDDKSVGKVLIKFIRPHLFLKFDNNLQKNNILNGGFIGHHFFCKKMY
jgi:hypothetical protein